MAFIVAAKRAQNPYYRKFNERAERRKNVFPICSHRNSPFFSYIFFSRSRLSYHRLFAFVLSERLYEREKIIIIKGRQFILNVLAMFTHTHTHTHMLTPCWRVHTHKHTHTNTGFSCYVFFFSFLLRSPHTSCVSLDRGCARATSIKYAYI